MLLSKESFVRTINFMKERNAKMEQLNKLFTEEFEDSIFFPYFKYEAEMSRVLKEIFNDTEEWIDYFCYERDFGKDLKLGDVKYVDGTPIPMSTPEELYDFLIINMKEKSEEKSE